MLASKLLVSTKPRDWLERTSLKWPVLCPVGRKTLTQSITNDFRHVFTFYVQRLNQLCTYVKLVTGTANMVLLSMVMKVWRTTLQKNLCTV